MHYCAGNLHELICSLFSSDVIYLVPVCCYLTHQPPSASIRTKAVLVLEPRLVVGLEIGILGDVCKIQFILYQPHSHDQSLICNVYM